MGTTGEVVEALRRAMLPALPKLDVALLQKALTAAKEDGGVDQKLIRSAEGKLSQAQKRAAMPSGQQIEERDVALEELKAAIKKAEALHVDANLTSEAWAKLDRLEQPVLAPLASQPSPDSVVTATAPPPGKSSLLQAVKDWRLSRSSMLQAINKVPAGLRLHSKFMASGDSDIFQYGSVQEFFAGLEGLVGSPSSDVMAAMERDHESDEPFEAWNANQPRVTTPRAEWIYVAKGRAGEPVPQVVGATVEGRARHPSHATDFTEGRAGWELKDFAAQQEVIKAGLMLPEVAGIRLYTGPMYVQYNNTLRKQVFGQFVTTLHAINSGIVKLSKLTKATTVYRGVTGLLPNEFWEENEHGVLGGVERAFMSTSTQRDVALGYMNQSNKTAKILFEIRMGMIDRGADVSCLSQFPAEREILFAPLTGLEVSAVPRDEEGVLVIELRLSCNLHDLTLEQVVGKMLTSHVSLIDVMMDNLRLGIPGLPPLVLEPLAQARAKAKRLGEADHTRFNQPQYYMEATRAALDANDACFASLATDEAWRTVRGEDAAVAVKLRAAAEKCANDDRPKEAATLLVIAAKRAGVSQESQEKAMRLISGRRQSMADVLLVLEAACELLVTVGMSRTWALTLVELGVRVGDRHVVSRLAKECGHSPSALWAISPLEQYPDLALDGYKAQPYFHQINTAYAGLQLINAEPSIFIFQDFLTPDECQEAINLFTRSSEKGSSAIGEEQTRTRTSTSIIYNIESGPTFITSLRERIAMLARVGTNQLQATKVSCYEKGQFFRPHTDANYLPEKENWLKQMMEGKATDIQTPEVQAFVPDRFCTIWIYLNDVPRGGHSRFKSSPDQSLYEHILPKFGESFGKHTPDVSRTRPAVDVSVKPKAGMAVLHFPTTTEEYMSMPDMMTLHEGEAAIDPKFIIQQFIWSSPLERVCEERKRLIDGKPFAAANFSALKRQLFGRESKQAATQTKTAAELDLD